MRETWTHKFFCLANTDNKHQPSRAEKFQLQSTGLGRKMIIFNWNDHPTLKDAAGFELLQSGPFNKGLVQPVYAIQNAIKMVKMPIASCLSI